jgi:hypothetical protein
MGRRVSGKQTSALAPAGLLHEALASLPVAMALRVEFVGGAVFLQCLATVPLPLERETKSVMRLPILRVQAHRLSLLGNHSLPIALFPQRRAKGDVRIVKLGVQAKRLTLFRNRPIPIALPS